MSKSIGSRTPLKSRRHKVPLTEDVWLQEDETSDDPFILSGSPRSTSNLKTPQKTTRVADLLEEGLKTPSGRSSRSQGLVNLTPKKSFIRKDGTGAKIETFTIGDQVLINPSASTSSYPWLHEKRRGGRAAQDDDTWEHVDGLEENEKVGLITEMFQDEKGDKNVKLRWFARPIMLWRDGGPPDDTPQDYEPWELCYVHDSEWCAAKQLVDHFVKLGKKMTPANMTGPEYAECSKALHQGSHTVDVLPISAITERVKVVSWSEFPDTLPHDQQPRTNDGHRLFRCRRIYDSRPMAWDSNGFVKDVDFEAVLAKGLHEGVWDIYVDRRDIESFDEDAADRRRLERRNRIKENNKKKRASQAQFLHSIKKPKMETLGSDKSSDTSDDDDADVDYRNDGIEDSEPESATGSEQGDHSNSDLDSNWVKPCKHQSNRRTKALPKTKLTAALKAKQARIAERKKKGLIARGQKSIGLRLPAANNTYQMLTETDPWARARQILHVSSTPSWLPCREEEFAELEAALEDSIEECSGCCLYISGVPGTGKTATVHSVVESLQAKVLQGDLNKFRFFEINGMKVTEPSQAFVLFWEYLSWQENGGEPIQKRFTTREALSNLEHYFSLPSPTRETCVLLVDELDQLVTRKQEVIYNFFNWPNQPHSRLIVIAVANKMDLPETELNGRIRSRLGSNRIQFKPYNHVQLMEILNMRLDELKDTIFMKDAIQWISKKISSLTGDVRKALDLCRSTLEKVEKENEIRVANGEEKRLIQVRDVIDTYEQMISSGVSRIVKQLSIHQRIMLISISKAIKVAGIPEVEMGDVISRHLRFSNSLGIKPEPTHEELMKVISSLENFKLLLNESSSFSYFSRIKLEIKETDLNLILKSDKRFSNLSV
ncbi:hypothetical protein O181_038857 [Austropuccinia psidii MF-1]|uniref:Origin recognition complex subunit 1 n=1 Tax=Austropuccinia psidii MF-1 TaxID=1389203 RepID=A0A9Q3DFK2_9BASI|nr:hypothetical protein [Austropuccinia psidii MF-1]